MARVPFGNTRGKRRNVEGKDALSKGNILTSFGDEGAGRAGNGMGAYVVVVVVVVITL